MVLKFLSRLEDTRPFTETEAWTLYKTAALGEAVGWTLLIAGILIRHFGLPGSRIAVPITGQIHGTVFLVYFGISIAVYSSLRWSRKTFLVALLAGVPPYGTLVFEQWIARNRRVRKRRIFFRNCVFSAMAVD